MGCICAKLCPEVVEGDILIEEDYIHIETVPVVGLMDIDEVINHVRNLHWMTRGYISSEESDEVFLLPPRFDRQQKLAWKTVFGELLAKVKKVDPDPEDFSKFGLSPPPMPAFIEEEEDEFSEVEKDMDDEVFQL